MDRQFAFAKVGNCGLARLLADRQVNGALPPDTEH